MSKHMKKKDITWRELFNEVKRYAAKDGDGVWDLPVAMWYGDCDKKLVCESAYTFAGVDVECLEYPTYEPAPINEENWLMLSLNNTTN